jgi:hypothetical protein
MQTKKGSTQGRKREQGIAMFLTLFALLLLSGIALTLIYSTNTETGINSNYRQEEIAYFAARAGVEEARDRMSTQAGVVGPIVPPPAPPGQASGYALYVINQGTDPTTVQPWVAGTTYMDDELCHEGYTGLGLTATAPGIRCTSVPSGSWYQTVTSDVQWSGTAAALPYKWVRVAMKENGSVEYGDPAQSGTQTYYSVNSTVAATQPVCYDGVSERVPPSGTTTCAAWAPTVYANSVYTITAMAVASSGARKVVQTEVGLAPNPPFPYGLFATGTTCGSITFSGSGSTNSYNSANGTYAATESSTGGDIGTFGNVSLSGNANIGGIIGVNVTTMGSCSSGSGTVSNGVTGSGSATADGCQIVNTSKCASPSNQWEQPLTAGLTFTTPTAPSPTPPTTNQNYSSSVTLPPGTYGNISMSGNATLTLSPGTYDINSLSASGSSSICVTPPGQVVLNIAGSGGTALNLSGQSTADATVSACGSSSTQSIPENFMIDYAGTGTITLSGQAASYLVVDAPNAALTISGQGAVYGAAVAKTITYSGQGAFHFDLNSAFRPQSNQNYTTLSFHEISY